MSTDEDSPICLNKNKCINKLCQWKHSQPDKKKQNFCDEYDYSTDSAEKFETHMEELHIRKSYQQIKDKQDLVFSVKLQLSKTFAFASFLSLKFISSVFSLQRSFSLKFILGPKKI